MSPQAVELRRYGLRAAIVNEATSHDPELFETILNGYYDPRTACIPSQEVSFSHPYYSPYHIPVARFTHVQVPEGEAVMLQPP